MSNRIGGGGSSAGGIPTSLESNKSEDAAKAAQDDALKDINKKTTQVVKNKQIDSDQFAVKKDLNITAGSADEAHQQAKAQAKIDETAMPELQKMIEDTLGTRMNPQQALKLQAKVKDNPTFKNAVEELKDVVEQWQQEALVKLAKEPPKTPEPSKSSKQNEDAQSGAKQGQQDPATKNLATKDLAKTPEPAQAKGLEKTPEKPLEKLADKADKTTPPPAKEAASKEADAKATDGAKDAKASKESADAKDAKGAKDAGKDTKETSDANAAKDAKETATKTTEEGAKLEEPLVNPLAIPPEGEVGQVDDLGNLIVEQEFYAMAAEEMAQEGLDTEFLAQYEVVATELDAPVFPPDQADPTTSTRMGSGDGGSLPTEPTASAQRLVSDTGTAAPSRTVSAQRLGGGPGGPGGTGGPGGPGGAGGAGNTGATTQVQSSLYAVLGDMEGKDYCEMCFLVLAEMMADLTKDLKQKQKMVSLRHKMNDAMRNYFAEFLKRASALAGKQIEKPSDYEKYRIKETYMEPRLVPGPNGEMEVTMVPAPIEMTFPPTNLEGDGEKKPDVHEDAVTTANRAVADWEEARSFGEPHSVTMENGEQGYVVTAATFWMTPATVGTRKEVLKTKIQAMKQDMEKEMLGVQKTNSLRKQVMENLNKTLRTRADEWQKSIQLLRR